MNKKKNLIITTAIGLSINSAALMVHHFIQIPDFIMGVLMGVGIGIMLLPLLRQKLRPN